MEREGGDRFFRWADGAAVFSLTVRGNPLCLAVPSLLNGCCGGGCCYDGHGCSPRVNPCPSSACLAAPSLSHPSEARVPSSGGWQGAASLVPLHLLVLLWCIRTAPPSGLVSTSVLSIMIFACSPPFFFFLVLTSVSNLPSVLCLFALSCLFVLVLFRPPPPPRRSSRSVRASPCRGSCAGWTAASGGSARRPPSSLSATAATPWWSWPSTPRGARTRVRSPTAGRYIRTVECVRRRLLPPGCGSVVWKAMSGRGVV